MASSLSTSGLALDSICAVLYTLLACGALLRLVQRHRQSGCPFRFFSSHARSGACFQRLAQCWTRTNVSCCCCSDPTDEFRQRTSHGGYSTLHSSASGGSSSSNSSNGAKKGYLVMLALLVYCVMRATQLALFAAGVLDSSGDITTNMYRFVPALGFMAVQSTMLYKWIDHVSELTLVLQHQAFGIGQFLMTCSVLLMLSDAVLTILALIDTQIVHFSHQPGHMWNVLVNMFCGVVYAFNGIAFSGLGCFLRYLWIPVTPMGAYASKRILGIALIFGVMCVGRGAILLMYIGDDSSDVNTHVHTVTHNDWGAPAVLLFEWTALVISLFLLTVAKHHNNNSSASNSMTAATIQPAVAFSSGGGGEAPLTEESGDAVAHSFRGDASSQFYIGGGTGRSTMSSSTTAGDHNNRATAVYHPRYSIGTASSEVSLATIGSNPNSSSSARATVGAPLPPRSTVVTSSSPFTSSSRSHHSMTPTTIGQQQSTTQGIRLGLHRLKCP
ncbi:membrane-associated protein, putative [Bodo saltans]|uniref:Membrane-associated protein, putative n=1 Tax=Bodo saltans TaxID=75058 RepID=A0A0S4ISA8_BODSA|nr:membrane-associated protein, putative [Bodo saltans]|eukprot:CUF55240.1 membrane-associated protein, putative [Bodo saltans]